MTVGIAVICEADTQSQKAVIAADRLVTTGVAARLEYENTSSKMTEIVSNDSVVSMGVGAGSMTLIDDFFSKLGANIDSAPPADISGVVESGLDAFNEILTEKAERQVLRRHGFETTEEFNSQQADLHPSIVEGLYNDVIKQHREVAENLSPLITGVDEAGAHIHRIRNGDEGRFDDVGYAAIGSGSQPARSSFLRNRYDKTCSIDEALLSVVEAKTQAERAQGVGKQMDIAILDGDKDENSEKVEILGDDDTRNLRKSQEEIAQAELDARRKVIEDADRG